MLPAILSDRVKDDVVLNEWKRCLPTARTVHNEIGIPLEHLTVAFQCSRNTLNKRLGEMPVEPVTKKQDITKIIDLYESALNDHKAKNFQKGTAAEKRWNREKVKYTRALESDLEETSELSTFKFEFGPKLKQYKTDNEKTLLESLERTFKKLSPEQMLKLAYWYNGYAGLFNSAAGKTDLVLLSVSIMTPKAKKEVKKMIDSIQIVVGQFRDWILYNGETIAECYKIRHEDVFDMRKSPDSAWDMFQKKFKKDESKNRTYAQTLGMAALINIFSQRNISDTDLDIIMSCAFLLSRKQESEMFYAIQKMLIPENIQPGYGKADVEEIIELSKCENMMIRLEHYLGVKSEDELGIYESDYPGDE